MGERQPGEPTLIGGGIIPYALASEDNVVADRLPEPITNAMQLFGLLALLYVVNRLRIGSTI